MVATVNSLPDSFLDMGRALSFFLLSVTDEEKADRVMSAISAFTVTGLSFFSVCYTICEGLNLSLIAVTLYLIIITFKRKVDK